MISRPPSPASTTRGARPGVHLALVAVQLFFGSSGVAMKIALREIPATGVATVRVLLGALGFLGMWLLFGRERIERGDLLRTALYAFFGVFANQLLFISGLARSSATHALVLAGAIPVFTVAVAVLLRRERATPLKLAGLALALGGALALTGGSWARGERDSFVGDAMVLVNCFCYAIYLVLTRDLVQRLRPLTVVTFTFVFGALAVTAVGGGALADAAPHAGRTTWLAIGYIVLFPTLGAYLLNALALRAAPASLVAVYIYLQPIIGTMLAAALLGERPAGSTYAAAALIFAGIGVISWDAQRRG